MKIVSKFTDVYDLQHSLSDPDSVWRRKTETMKMPTSKESPKLLFTGTIPTGLDRFRGGRFFCNIRMVFIAGVVHPLFTIEHGGDEMPEYMYNVGSVGRYDFMTFDPNKFADRAALLGGRTICIDGEWDLRDDSPQKVMDKFMTMFNVELRPKAEAGLRQCLEPLVLVNAHRKGLVYEKDTQETTYYDLSTNFCFNDLRLPWPELEPNLYILHQTLEQYLFGVLGGKTPEVISTSDKDRLEAHGFSNKFSFRNMERN